MTRLIDVVRRKTEERTSGWDWYQQQLQQFFSYQGLSYPFGMGTTLDGSREDIENDYAGYVQGAYKRNGIVFACVALRTRVFSEARFAWQTRDNGRPQQPYTDQRLARLDRPWPGGTTQDLLQRVLLGADMGGNTYVTQNRHRNLRILRPDWVTIVRGSDIDDPDNDPDGIDATLIGYLYKPGGPTSNSTPVPLLPDQVSHFAPDPDPEAMFRGMSWLTPVLREISGDSAMNAHKNKFLENAATPNIVVRMDSSVTPEQFKDFKAKAEEQHKGVWNAYKTMYLGGGADVTVAGSDMRQLDFKVVQGHGETRIAAAAGVHPVVVGLSEGMQGSSLNAGNYTAARRNVADTTFNPLWRNAAGSLQVLLKAGAGEELIADLRDVPFLRSDESDAAATNEKRASTINTLITAGFDPAVSVEAVTTGDYSKLQSAHTGLVSVQLQPPGATPDSRSVEVPARQVAELVRQGWRIKENNDG